MPLEHAIAKRQPVTSANRASNSRTHLPAEEIQFSRTASVT